MDGLLDHLWAALRERFGLVLTTDEPDRLRQRLYALRAKNLGDFESLSLSVADGRVWIINREGLQESADAETQREPDET